MLWRACHRAALHSHTAWCVSRVPLYCPAPCRPLHPVCVYTPRTPRYNCHRPARCTEIKETPGQTPTPRASVRPRPFSKISVPKLDLSRITSCRQTIAQKPRINGREKEPRKQKEPACFFHAQRNNQSNAVFTPGQQCHPLSHRVFRSLCADHMTQALRKNIPCLQGLLYPPEHRLQLCGRTRAYPMQFLIVVPPTTWEVVVAHVSWWRANVRCLIQMVKENASFLTEKVMKVVRESAKGLMQTVLKIVKEKWNHMCQSRSQDRGYIISWNMPGLTLHMHRYVLLPTGGSLRLLIWRLFLRILNVTSEPHACDAAHAQPAVLTINSTKWELMRSMGACYRHFL